MTFVPFARQQVCRRISDIRALIPVAVVVRYGLRGCTACRIVSFPWFLKVDSSGSSAMEGLKGVPPSHPTAPPARLSVRSLPRGNTCVFPEECRSLSPGSVAPDAAGWWVPTRAGAQTSKESAMPGCVEIAGVVVHLPELLGSQ